MLWQYLANWQEFGINCFLLTSLQDFEVEMPTLHKTEQGVSCQCTN